MKIVRIIARLNVGGPAKHVVWLTRGLQNSGCQTVLVAGTVAAGEDDMGYFATEMGVAPVFVPEMSREVSAKDALTIWKLYKLFLRERPDIVHTHTAKAGTVGRLAGFFYRWLTPGVLMGYPRQCRFVHTYHGHIFHSYYGPLKTRLYLAVEKVLARLVTDRIVVISEQQRAEINEDFGVGRAKQFVIIPLGLDTAVFTKRQPQQNSFREEFGFGHDDILVGIVGRLTEIKNHELFLRAAATFKARFSHERLGAAVKFLVIGDGALRRKLEQQATELGLASDITFTGSRRDPENFYPALDIVALTSRNEGTPLTLIEAMANARPVISTAVGGVIDLLGEPVTPKSGSPFVIRQRGISVPTDDASAFAEGLNWLVANESLRRDIGRRGFEFVQTQHSQERLLKDVNALYADLVEGRMRSAKIRSPEPGFEPQSLKKI